MLSSQYPTIVKSKSMSLSTLQKYFFSVLFLFLTLGTSMAAKTYIPAGGNWSTAGNWSPAGVPGAGDDVDLSGLANKVTVTADATCKNLTLCSSTAGSVTVNAGLTLTVTGVLNSDAWVGADIIGGAGTIKLTGLTPIVSGNWNDVAIFDNLIFAPGAGKIAVIEADISFASSLTVSSGTVQPTYDVASIHSSLTDGGIVTVAAGATLDLESGATTMLFGGNTYQILGEWTYDRLSSVVINGTLKTAKCVNTKELTINTGGSLRTLYTGNFYSSAAPTTFTCAGTMEYASGGDQTIFSLSPSTTYYNLILSGSGTKKLGGNVTVTNSATYKLTDPLTWFERDIYTLTSPAAQRLTGIKTVGSGSNYLTLYDAVRHLNLWGPGDGGITYQLKNETFNIDNSVGAGEMKITATGTSANPIKFIGSGGASHPILAGKNIPNPYDYHAILYFVGSDYVTLDGLNFTINNSDNRIHGIYFSNLGTDGCNNNTIQNCVIDLIDPAHTNGNDPLSRGIYIYNNRNGVDAAGAGNQYGKQLRLWHRYAGCRYELHDRNRNRRKC